MQEDEHKEFITGKTYEFCMYETGKHRHIVNSGFIQNLKVLECLWNWKQKFKALNALEFVKKYLKVLKFLLLNLVSGYFLKLFDIQNGHFVELILHIHIWQSCLKIACRNCFKKFNVRFYWFLTPFLQYLVLEFADTWPWIWIVLTCTNPVN
jgi:hypothetical protein